MKLASALRNEKLDLRSPLACDECLRRLGAMIDSPWTLKGVRPFIGCVRDNRISVRRRIPYRNSFQTSLSAALVPEGDETRLHCRLGLHPFVRAFMIVWFAGVVSIGGPILLISVWRLLHGACARPKPADLCLGVLVPAGLLLFGVVLVIFGRFLARGERDELLASLQQTVRAYEV